MIETLFHRDASGAHQLGIITLPVAIDAGFPTREGVCACYFVRVRVTLPGNIPCVVKLRVPYIPTNRLFPTLATFDDDSRAIVALVARQHPIDETQPIELLDLSLATLARVEDAAALVLR